MYLEHVADYDLRRETSHNVTSKARAVRARHRKSGVFRGDLLVVAEASELRRLLE